MQKIHITGLESVLYRTSGERLNSLRLEELDVIVIKMVHLKDGKDLEWPSGRIG